MVEIDPITGLPKELGVWESIAKEDQEITIALESKKFSKKYTVITGIDSKEIDLDDLVKKLKSKLACGGTAKDGKIELQGNHVSRVREILIELGFPPDALVTK
ncbi:translation initiation factor [Candidatus Woesearchaeota archaeon]|nr:translation initiation factor [Candidatus Woesearchaeota archaeon]